ncbi:MAG TPA: hypothetical protein VEU27_16400 [Gemmatimonadales bacterium]|nr:hypothetical protein [Gemmatimonadales bacterium]
MSQPERRASERFSYRPELRPLLIIAEQAYEILDLGERGLRCRCGDPERWLLGSEVEGTVWFQRDSRMTVHGTVVRAGAGELVLKLGAGGIPAQALLDEIRYIHAPRR